MELLIRSENFNGFSRHFETGKSKELKMSTSKESEKLSSRRSDRTREKKSKENEKIVSVEKMKGAVGKNAGEKREKGGKDEKSPGVSKKKRKMMEGGGGGGGGSGGKEERNKGKGEKKISEVKIRKHGKPFEKLLDDVVFVISGFQNPLRGNIRNMALKMGARYSPDWKDDECTHLV